MMTKYIRHSIYLLPLLAGCFLAGCQKTQTASASAEEQAGTAQYGPGENPNDPQMNPDGQASGTSGETSDATGSSGGGNRFGFAGANSEGPVKPLKRDNRVYSASNNSSSSSAPKPPSFRDSRREVAENFNSSVDNTTSSVNNSINKTAGRIEEKIAPPEPPPAPSPPKVDTSKIVQLGFADSIPGDNLQVKLPGQYASLPAISVERHDASGNPLGTPYSRGTLMQIPNPQVPGGKIYFKVP